jgi:4-hydroxymandelate oxidase
MDLNALWTVGDVERAAHAALDPATWAYVAGGAGSERSVRANVSAFDAVWLRPRLLARPCARPATATSVLGQELSLPVLLAPTSPQRLLHADAELATARAAAAAGTISVVSTDSHYRFPAIAEQAAERCWFQLYAYRSRADVEATIEMAIAAGATALVVTMDAHFQAGRISARRAGFRTPEWIDFGNLRALGILDGEVPANARLDRLPLTWEDLEWIRRRSPVPLLIKGLLHPADARRCVELGADGVIVSNHGGRQLDGVVPSLIALEAVAREVRDECAVLLDGGIRSGIDVVRALALGAHAVGIGRPYLWGLAVAGQQGVEAVIAILRRELEDALLQLGLPTVAAVESDCVAEVRWAPPAGGERDQN